MHVLPKRNNAFLNNTSKSPLLAIAHGANHDIKYIDTPYGSAQYCASYISKGESADFKLFRNVFSKKILYLETDRDYLKAVSNSLLEATAIGAVQACYVLLGLDFVISTRQVVNVNSLPRNILTNRIIIDRLQLSIMDDEDSALSNSIHSQLGQRDAFNKLIKQQYNTFSSCNITYFIMLTYYSLSIYRHTAKKLLLPPPLLKLHTTGRILDAPTKFRIDGIVYTLKKRPVVINLSPHIPYDPINEKSCFSLLLMHYPWPLNGELAIVVSESINKVKNLLQNDLFPHYIKQTLDKYNVNLELEHTQNEYITNKLTENTSSELSDECETSDDERNMYFMEEPTQSCNIEINYNSLQTTLNTNFNQNGIISNIPLNTYLGYKNFLSNALALHMDNYNLNNATQIDQILTKQTNDNSIKNYILEEMISTLRPLQLKAFNIVKNYVTNNTKQLGLFLTGEGGTGKSKVIEAIVQYTRNYFGKTNGFYGPIIVTAPTGTSSNNINGFTYHSVCCFSRTKHNHSDQSSQKMGKRIAGAKLIVIDEISLTSLEDFYKQHLAYSRALSTLTECHIEKKQILQTPFGGLHVILVGDLYQLRCVKGTPFFSQNIRNEQALKGHQLLFKILNEYIELTENCRFNNAELSIFAKFLHYARTGNNKVIQYLDEINKACIELTPTTSSKCNNPNTLWLADTNKDVSKINHNKLQQLLNSSPVAYRIISRHTSVRQLISAPNQLIKEKLYKIQHDKHCLPYIDLAVGARVMVTKNLATQIGIYNGATGTVVGFGFHQSLPDEAFPAINTFHTLINRELPIVFVKMDKYTGKQLSNNEDRQNIIPITEYVDDITLKVNGIHYMRWQIPLIVAYSITTHKSQSMTAHNGIVYEPSIRSPFTRGLPYVALSRATDLDKVSLLSAIRNDHFISNKFLAENETIANFYSLLKKNYSTDVALIDK
jgi:hypothetical protein